MGDANEEALSLIQTARTNLLGLHELAGDGDARDEHDPDVLNDAFRAVHPLASVLVIKGESTAGMSEAVSIGHMVCNRLDDFRMSRLPLTAVNIGGTLEALELLARWVETPASIEAPAFAEMERALAKLGKQGQQL